MRRRADLAALGAALAAALVLALAGCSSPAASPRRKVAVVAKSTSTEFWKAVFTGAEAAATEYNLELTITGPETEEDYETQNAMVAQAVADGAQALVFSAIDYEANAEAINAAARAGVYIVGIDSAVNSSLVRTYIGTNNYAAGCMAAQAALDGREGALRVGLVNYDRNSANGQAREQGARDTFAQSGRAEIVAGINTLSSAEGSCADTAAMLAMHPEIDVLLAFNEPISVGAARAVKQAGKEDDIFFVAFDSNVETVDGLQTGEVDALIVQNTYAMGYLGVESAYKLLTGNGDTLEQTVDTTTRIINRENMFTMDGQKALFPFE